MIRSTLIILIAFMISGMIGLAQIASYKTQAAMQKAAGIKLSGPFTLEDHNGAAFTQTDLIGHYSLIYFGFTSCPAVCPTELQKINVAISQAGNAGETVQPIFITIDPGRDTKEVMTNYVGQFSPRFRGLTGTPEQIEQAEKAFHVYARKVEDAQLSDYTMDHSSYIYWVGPDGDIVSLFGPSTTAAEITATIQKNAS